MDATKERGVNGRINTYREMESNKSLHSYKQVCKVGFKIWKNHRNRGKKLHFFGVNDFKI